MKTFNKFKLLNINYLVFALCLLLVTSCVPHSKLVYLKMDNKNEGIIETSINRQTIIIQPGDELFLRVSSLGADQNNNFFNTSMPNIGVTSNSSLSLMGYTVNTQGYITVPVIGILKVAGLTLDQAGENLKDSLKNYLNNPTVVVKFINRFYTVLGYVRTPGQYEFANEKVNIIQALGRAGDIIDYGNRKKVYILREENNTIKQVIVDLTAHELIKSEYFYLKPGDVIYVQPLKARFWGFNTFPFTLLLTTISTTILVLNYTK